MTRPKQHTHPAQRPAHEPALPAGVTPELVTALAALSRVGSAWQKYEAAVKRAANATHGGVTLGEATERRHQVETMLPTDPAAAIAAAGRNAVILAALTAAAGRTA